jgi:acid phosphatase
MASIPRLALSAVRLSTAAFAALPRYDHIVVVIEENHSFTEILGLNSRAPYLRFLADGGATLTQSFGIVHPSEPNYLALFSGSTQGVIDDSVPPGTPLSTPNLGAALFAKGLTFAGFSQSLPQLGFLGVSATTAPGEHQYERKHNPWSNRQSVTPGPHQLPPWTNLPFEHTFPTRPDGDFSVLPTIAFVIPDERYDMHDGSITAADDWLRAHLSAYAGWAQAHNSLLIVTFDEDDGSQGNRIPTIFYGAHLRPGRHKIKTDHYGLLRTLEDLYGLDHAGASARATPLAGIFSTP